MATYCFLEDKYKLWTEMCLRGFVAGCLDFPHQMDMAALEAAAQSIPDEIRPETCCIQEYPFRHLTINAWGNGYAAAVEASERNLTVFALTCRVATRDEVLAYARHACSPEARALIDEAWDSYCRGVVS